MGEDDDVDDDDDDDDNDHYYDDDKTRVLSPLYKTLVSTFIFLWYSSIAFNIYMYMYCIFKLVTSKKLQQLGTRMKRILY